MNLGRLGTIAATGLLAANWALAQQQSNQKQFSVTYWDTLSQIALDTWISVEQLLSQNPFINDRFWSVCEWVVPWTYFCTQPEHTIFVGDTLKIANIQNTIGNMWENASIDNLVDSAWLQNPDEAKRVISEWITKIPWLTPENAVKVVSKLEKIPVTSNVGVTIDMSGSTSEDRVMIANFINFILEDRKLASEVLSEWNQIGNIDIYGYTSVTEKMKIDEDLTSKFMWDGGVENTIWAINEAYQNGSEYVIVITDEPWDDTGDIINKDNTTIFMIQDSLSCRSDCWDNHPYWWTPLGNHGEVVYLNNSNS